MLNSITLRNWRSHDDSYLNFSSGTNIVIGRMGGGKSSIIDAICFALFGTCPAIQHRRIKVTDLIRNRPNKQKDAEVELNFNHRNEEYVIKRRVKHAGVTEAEIRKNGSVVEGPQSVRVTEFVSHLLDINYDLFTRAIYSEQNRIDYFLTIPKGERKRQIDELLGLTKFEAVRKNTITAIGRLKAIHTDKEQILKSFDTQKIGEELSSLEKEMGKIREKLDITEKESSTLSEKKKDIEEEYQNLEKTREKYKELTNNKTGFSHTLKSIETEINNYQIDEKKITEIEKEFERIEKERGDLQKSISEISNRLSKLSKDLGTLEGEERELNKDLEKRDSLSKSLKELLAGSSPEIIEKELKTKEEQVKGLTKEIAQKDVEISDLGKALEELKKSKEKAKCPTCDSDLSEIKRNEIIKKKESLKEDATKKLKEIEEKIQSENSELEGLQKRINEIGKIEPRLKDFEGIENKLKETKTGKETIENEVKKLTDQKNEKSGVFDSILKDYSNITKEIERINEFKKKQKRLDEIKTELDKIEEELLKLKFDEGKWEKLRKEVEELNLKETKVNGELERLRELEKYSKEKFEDRKTKLNEVKKYEEELEYYGEMIQKLQLFSNAVIETQHSLREELVEAINEALSESWNVLYPYSDYPAIKIQPSESDYDLVFRTGESWLSLDGIASGGERALACLALRVAFAMVLTPNLSWLILDEPTHNLDEEAVRKLAGTLHDHIPRIVEQTFVITHDENLRDAASGKLFKIERGGDAPEISSVQEITT